MSALDQAERAMQSAMDERIAAITERDNLANELAAHVATVIVGDGRLTGHTVELVERWRAASWRAETSGEALHQSARQVKRLQQAAHIASLPKPESGDAEPEGGFS